ncbi:hypothetical protein Q8G50_32650, partial [Klebsiella pneumoniae]
MGSYPSFVEGNATESSYIRSRNQAHESHPTIGCPFIKSTLFLFIQSGAQNISEAGTTISSDVQ